MERGYEDDTPITSFPGYALKLRQLFYALFLNKRLVRSEQTNTDPEKVTSSTGHMHSQREGSNYKRSLS